VLAATKLQSCGGALRGSILERVLYTATPACAIDQEGDGRDDGSNNRVFDRLDARLVVDKVFNGFHFLLLRFSVVITRIACEAGVSKAWAEAQGATNVPPGTHGSVKARGLS
jgi:hypothetical protein